MNRYVMLERESLHDLLERVNSITTHENRCDGTYAYRLVNIFMNQVRNYTAVFEDTRTGYTAADKELV